MSGSCLFYGELNSIVLDVPDGGDAFTITRELCNIGYFEFTVANTAANRTAIDANYTHDFYIKRTSDDAEVFRGRIGKKKYLNRNTMLLSGREWYVTLSYKTFKHIPASDLIDPAFVMTYTNMGGYVDKTTAATNSTINDVPIAFDEAYASINIGSPSPFNAIKVKYSTKGVCSAHDLQYAYMRNMGDYGATKPLQGVLDLSQGFTKDAGTYYIMFDNPNRWMKTLLSTGNYEYYIFLRIHPANSTPYTTPPIIDQIWIGKPTKSEADDRPITPLRIEYIDTAANTILADVLTGTGFSIGSCPSTQISIRGEYLTPLQWIAAKANALSWIDANGFENPYEWSINASNHVYITMEVGPPETPTEDGQYFSLLEVETCYDEFATRILGLGAFTGVQQPSSYAEDYDASEIRELVVADLRFGNQTTFDAHTKKILTELRVPPEVLSVDVLTSSPSAQHFGWIDDYGIGQRVQIKQPTWGITNSKYRILRASIGPVLTKLDLGTSQKHLESLRADLAAKMDISDIWAAGAAQQSNDGGYF